MRRPTLTLLTDFGPGGPHVASMKGVDLGLVPDATFVDVDHGIAHHDVAEAGVVLASVFASFHGRDFFAPADASGVRGQIIHVDRFGNLASNVRGDFIEDRPGGTVEVEGHRVGPLTRTYGESPTGSVVDLQASAGLVELAEVDGSAAKRLGLGVGASLRHVINDHRGRA